jgi:hypothetical protein
MAVLARDVVGMAILEPERDPVSIKKRGRYA